MKFECRVPVPPIKEQRQIAHVLTAAKRELSLLYDELTALTLQKRGLMRVEVGD